MKRVIVGKAVCKEYADEYYTYYLEYGDVTNETEDLSDILKNEFEDKKVKVTIEVVE